MMINQVEQEMWSFKQRLNEMAFQLRGCNWQCLDQCQTHSYSIVAKGQCLKQCNCFSSIQSTVEAEPTTEPAEEGVQNPATQRFGFGGFGKKNGAVVSLMIVI